MKKEKRIQSMSLQNSNAKYSHDDSSSDEEGEMLRNA